MAGLDFDGRSMAHPGPAGTSKSEAKKCTGGRDPLQAVSEIDKPLAAEMCQLHCGSSPLVQGRAESLGEYGCPGSQEIGTFLPMSQFLTEGVKKHSVCPCFWRVCANKINYN